METKWTSTEAGGEPQEEMAEWTSRLDPLPPRLLSWGILLW